jgi:hypothetical protein
VDDAQQRILRVCHRFGSLRLLIAGLKPLLNLQKSCGLGEEPVSNRLVQIEQGIYSRRWMMRSSASYIPIPNYQSLLFLLTSIRLSFIVLRMQPAFISFSSKAKKPAPPSIWIAGF